MRHYRGGFRVMATAFFCMMLASGIASAQTRRGVAPAGARASEPLRVRRLEGIGKQYLIKTPEYRTSMSPGTKRPSDWAEVKVTFDTAPEWIDDITVQYYVLTAIKGKAGVEYSFFNTTARYADVEQGNGHMVAAYLTPAAVKRYGDPVAVAVAITVAGKTVAEESDNDRLVKLPERWWESSGTVLGSEAVTPRNGYLLSRRQTPFALINISDYEAEQY